MEHTGIHSVPMEHTGIHSVPMKPYRYTFSTYGTLQVYIQYLWNPTGIHSVPMEPYRYTFSTYGTCRYTFSTYGTCRYTFSSYGTLQVYIQFLWNPTGIHSVPMEPYRYTFSSYGTYRYTFSCVTVTLIITELLKTLIWCFQTHSWLIWINID